MTPKVSILLSIYKSEAYLSSWLKNVIQLSIWHEIELIIVANAPSSREQEIISEFLKSWREQTHYIEVDRENLYKSWNRCLNIATGKYCAIANVDDLRTPDGLEQQVNILEKHLNYLFCFSDFWSVTTFPSTKGTLVNIPNYKEEELTRGMLAGPFFIWRREDNNSRPIRFDEQFKSGGDFDFAVRLALAGQGFYHQEPVGYYLNQGTGLSTGSDLQPIERIVIELRYGIYDKIEYQYLPKAFDYDVKFIHLDNERIPISDFIDNYEEWISSRQKDWFNQGLIRSSFFAFLKKSKTFLVLKKTKSMVTFLGRRIFK
ncbi:hypothetical protein NBRC116602_23980 [Hyphomicrobiales bacterium 4NK60-0047b]